MKLIPRNRNRGLYLCVLLFSVASGSKAPATDVVRLPENTVIAEIFAAGSGSRYAVLKTVKRATEDATVRFFELDTEEESLTPIFEEIDFSRFPGPTWTTINGAFAVSTYEDTPRGRECVFLNSKREEVRRFPVSSDEWSLDRAPERPEHISCGGERDTFEEIGRVRMEGWFCFRRFEPGLGEVAALFPGMDRRLILRMISEETGEEMEFALPTFPDDTPQKEPAPGGLNLSFSSVWHPQVFASDGEGGRLGVFETVRNSFWEHCYLVYPEEGRVLPLPKGTRFWGSTPIIADGCDPVLVGDGDWRPARVSIADGFSFDESRLGSLEGQYLRWNPAHTFLRGSDEESYETCFYDTRGHEVHRTRRYDIPNVLLQWSPDGGQALDTWDVESETHLMQVFPTNELLAKFPVGTSIGTFWSADSEKIFAWIKHTADNDETRTTELFAIHPEFRRVYEHASPLRADEYFQLLRWLDGGRKALFLSRWSGFFTHDIYVTCETGVLLLDLESGEALFQDRFQASASEFNPLLRLLNATAGDHFFYTIRFSEEVSVLNLETGEKKSVILASEER